MKFRNSVGDPAHFQAMADAYQGPDAYRGSQGPFPPLSKVREGLAVRWYRSPTPRGALARLTQRSDAEGLFQACGHLLLWASTLALAYYCWSGPWPVAAVAVIAHGTVASTFVYGCHEMGHGTVFRTAALNGVFLHVFSLLFWWDPIEYAMSHTHHHRYTLFPEADRENLAPTAPSLAPRVLFELFTLNLTARPGRVFGKGGLLACVELTLRAACGGVAAPAGTAQHEWLSALHADRPDRARASMRWNQAVVAFHGAVFGLALHRREPEVFLLVSCGCFFGNWLSYFVGETQHSGLTGSVPDFRQNTRSVVLPRAVEFLFWNMNWHMEHHMYASVPFYNLKKLHAVIEADVPEPRTLVGAWREMRAIHARQLDDPNYEYVVPLPATAGRGGAALFNKDGTRRAPRGDEAEAESIGDLAPEEKPKAA